MNNWKVIPTIVLATVLIFSAGVFTGGLLVDHVKPTHAKKPSRPEAAAPAPAVNNASTLPVNSTNKPIPKLPEILSKPFLMKLDEQLHLSAEQHKTVEKILSEGQNDMKRLMQSTRLEIREVLTPEQLTEFDNLVKRPNRKPSPPNPAMGLSTNSPLVLTNVP